MVMAQHGPGEILATMTLKVGTTGLDTLHQRRAMNALLKTFSQ